jgi:malate dehydrogenase
VQEVVEWDLTEFEREQFGEAADKLSEQYDEIA